MQFDLTEGKPLYRGDIYSFYGLNRKRKGGRGEFEDMYNMSSIEYPCIAPRMPRKKVFEAPGSIQAVAAPDFTNTMEATGFTGIANEQFYYNGTVKYGAVFSNEYQWQIIRMGNLYIINGFAQRRGTYDSVLSCYNEDTGKLFSGSEEMDSLIVTAGNNSKGSFLATFRYGFSEVYNYSVTDIYGVEINNSDFFDKYAYGYELPSSNIFSKVFTIGDEVTISGFPSREENTGQIWTHSSSTVLPQTAQDFEYNNTVDTDLVMDISELSDYTITYAEVSGFDVGKLTLNGRTIYVHYIYFNLKNKNDEKISFDSMQSSTYTFYCSGVRIKKRERVFDNIAVHHGRIWGTLPTGNAVFASASDDIFSFSSSDITKMYAARLTSDTEGRFTGMCEYNDEICAFKENSITIIYGSNASNYTESVIRGTGCIDGRSVAVTLDGVIFLAYNGFYLYSGGVPQCISESLNTRYVSATGGFDGTCYYASAVKENGESELLVYDMRYGVWHRQDDFKALGFFRFRGGFYMADERNVYNAGTGTEKPEWSITSVRIHDNMLDNKGIHEIWVRADVEEGAEFTVYTSCGNDDFIKHTTFSQSGLHVFRCPVRLIVGTSYRYRLEGKGNVVIYEVELVKSSGGRRYKEC